MLLLILNICFYPIRIFYNIKKCNLAINAFIEFPVLYWKKDQKKMLSEVCKDHTFSSVTGSRKLPSSGLCNYYFAGNVELTHYYSLIIFLYFVAQFTVFKNCNVFFSWNKNHDTHTQCHKRTFITTLCIYIMRDTSLLFYFLQLVLQFSLQNFFI